MNGRLTEMDHLRTRRTEQLELALSEGKQPEQIRMARMKEEKNRINAIFKEWTDWVKESMSLEEQAHIQVLALFAKAR